MNKIHHLFLLYNQHKIHLDEYVYYQYFKKDTDCEVIMRNWFDKDMADERKRMLGE